MKVQNSVDVKQPEVAVEPLDNAGAEIFAEGVLLNVFMMNTQKD